MFKFSEEIDQADRCYVDVAGKGTVIIVDSPDGIIVDIYPRHVVDGPVATCGADMSDLMPPESRVANNYWDDECPECGEFIPDDLSNDEGCPYCGYSLPIETEVDDYE